MRLNMTASWRFTKEIKQMPLTELQKTHLKNLIFALKNGQYKQTFHKEKAIFNDGLAYCPLGVMKELFIGSIGGYSKLLPYANCFSFETSDHKNFGLDDMKEFYGWNGKFKVGDLISVNDSSRKSFTEIATMIENEVLNASEKEEVKEKSKGGFHFSTSGGKTFIVKDSAVGIAEWSRVLDPELIGKFIEVLREQKLC